jgi:4-hydroxythreonine-4-phosphate dehydrogenase
MAEQIKIGITQGDINSIGYEVILKTLMDTRMLDVCVPILYGSSKVVAFYRKLVDADSFNFSIIRSAGECNPKRANIINVMDDTVMVEVGVPTPTSGKGAMDALTAATRDLQDGKIDAVVTAPIDKQNMASVGFAFAGHTEYFANAFNSEPLMLLINETLRIGTVTGHIALADVAVALSKELIVNKIELLNQSLTKDFGLHRPRIAVLALNPHAGDKGLMGGEETTIIIPALEEAAKRGFLVFGPYPADGFFAHQYTNYDGILAMYHDQGLAPFKALSAGNGVNYTAGLPIVRTSPAHGTAFDIVGKNIASPDSFRNAIYAACDIVKNRREYAEISANPL